jgi:hypothetical protein
MMSKKNWILIAAMLLLLGCDKAPKSGAQAQPQAQAMAAPPSRPLPQQLTHPLFIVDRIHFAHGSTIKQANTAIFRSLSEKEQLSTTQLVCGRPFPKKAKPGEIDISEDTDCKSMIMTRTPDGDSFTILLDLYFGPVKTANASADTNEGSLSRVEESFPQKYADDARAWLQSQYGEPRSFNPTTWGDSSGCSGYTPSGRMIYKSGGCYSITLMQSTNFFYMEPLQQEMTEDEQTALLYKWETVEFTDFISPRDIEHAKADWQPTGEISAKQPDGSYLRLICDGAGNCVPKKAEPKPVALTGQ